MQENEEKSKCALVTPSGKQIMLRNDLERVFNNASRDLVSLMHNRETPQDIRNAFYFASPGDIDFKAFNSPMIYGLSFSPLKPSGMSFYETFSRRFKSSKPSGQEDGTPGRPGSKFEGIIPDMLDPLDREPLAPNPPVLLRAPHASLSSVKELLHDPSAIVSLSESPLNLDMLRVDSTTADSSNKERDDSVQPPPLLPPSASAAHLECDISKYGNTLIKLKELFQILNKVFNHRAILTDEYSLLIPFEEDLLNSMLQRKFLKKLRPRDFELDVDKKVDLINEIINTKSHKRPEECYKFVLTRVIKHLKKYLKSLGGGNRDIESYFYEYYFTQTAEELGLPLTDFHYPLTGNKSRFKLNSKYFERIFKSAAFLDRLNAYLNGLLERDYKIEIAKKLESLLLRWDNMMMEAGSDSQATENTIKEYLLKNKRCKLPWTIHEVHESVERFRSLLKNFQTNNNGHTDSQ